MKTLLVEGKVLLINLSPTTFKAQFTSSSEPSWFAQKKSLFHQNDHGAPRISLLRQLFCTTASQTIKRPSNIICNICKIL